MIFFSSIWSEYGICNLSVCDMLYFNLEAQRNTVAWTVSVVALWTAWTNQGSQNNTAKPSLNSHGKDSVKYPWNISSRQEKLKHKKGYNNNFFLVSALFIGSYSNCGMQSSGKNVLFLNSLWSDLSRSARQDCLHTHRVRRLILVSPALWENGSGPTPFEVSAKMAWDPLEGSLGLGPVNGI